MATNNIVNLNGATQAQQETGTELAAYVAPGVQQFHPSAAKVWAKIVGAGTSISASYNVTSITDAGVGLVTVTIATDFSSVDYSVVGYIEANAYDEISFVQSGSQAAGSVQLTCAVLNVQTDPNFYYIACFGDQ